MRTFAKRFHYHRPWQCKHRLSYTDMVWWSWSGPCVLLQPISNSIVHDNLSTVSTTIIDFDGSGSGSCVLLLKVSNSIVHDSLSTISAIIINCDGPGVGSYVRLQTISNNSIVRDNVSNILALILDFGGPGRGNAYICKRFQMASSMTVKAPSQLQS